MLWAMIVVYSQGGLRRGRDTWIAGKPVGKRCGWLTNCTKGLATLYPLGGKACKAARLLKIKGKKAAFSPPKATTLLKIKPLTINPTKSEKWGVNCPTVGVPNCRWKVAEKAWHRWKVGLEVPKARVAG